MNTTQIKKFAALARTELLKGVSNKLKAFFDEKGNPHIVPQPIQGGCVYGEQLQDEKFYRAWQSLNKHIAIYGFNGTVEEVAYTWFNRLIAINILSKNSLAVPVLHFSNPAVRVPFIVELARSGQIPEMSVISRRALNELLNDDSKTFEQFTFLIDSYCSANPIIKKCFGKVDDYSFLLLPNNILAKGSLVDMLNSSDIISDEDYRSPELIGWLYQFYISERKDEVFAKKGKFESDEIPAATQIFTPNWIVKYMVQNSLGRIYLDNEPYSDLAPDMEYLVPTQPTAEKFTFTDVKELTCADLACGSGHILNECFDLLYDIYIEQGYSRKDAVENIFAYNLVGIDIDNRAKQMATFALLLKACRKDMSFIDAHAMPRVYDMPDPYPRKTELREILPYFFLGGTPKMIEETADAIALFDEAKNLGSIMKFNISPSTREAISRRLAEYRQAGHTDIDSLFPYLDIILALTDKYAALVMNPPYMGAGNMNPVLSKYVKDNYEEGKADLFSTFMLLAIDRLAKNGKYGMINMHSWMFLSSFEKLRATILSEQHIDNLLHLGPRTFDELSGEVVQNAAFVISKSKNVENGTYYRLVDGKNCADKQRMFLEAQSFDKVYYPNISQDNFEKIPGCPIGYWVSENFIRVIQNDSLANLAHPRRTIQCGDVDKFIRLWYEVSCSKIEQSIDIDELKESSLQWFRFSNGGASRRWYGNLDSVLYWRNNGQTIKETGKAIIPNEELYFIKSIGYNRITSNGISARLYQEGILLGDATSMIVPGTNFNYYLALLNSKVSTYSMQVFNPTLAAQTGSLSKIPILFDDVEKAKSFVSDCINIAKLDWDAHETSWDFKENELVALAKEGRGRTSATIDGTLVMEYNTLEALYSAYTDKWRKKFYQLHANEEELNRQFIEIYGLQDELTPDVPLEEITILQEGEKTIVNGELKFNKDVVIKQLLSYIIGCWMGRYRLDKPGLHIAHPAPTEEEVATYTYCGNEFTIDDDGIIPILSSEASFADNACHRVRDFLRITFGYDSLIENINFIQAALGKDLETYFLKDFWKDHKKMYQNRPIYWLFSSKKGAFQCLAYMHRMDAYTAERVRSKYLLPHIESLGIRITELVANEAMLSTAQRRTLDRLRKELDECREYHDRLHLVADRQIAFDLDDGVVVNHAKFGDVLAKIK